MYVCSKAEVKEDKKTYESDLWVTAKEKRNVSTIGVVVHYKLPNQKDQSEDFGE